MLSLDTNIVIAIMTRRSPLAVARFHDAVKARTPLMLSVVVLLELEYGAEKSLHPDRNRSRIVDFLQAPLEVLPFTQQDARHAAALRADLERQGRPIGPYDVQIAAQALDRGLTVVTDNEREFRRIAQLQVTNWLRP
jgi:tRNA(fMet)-specific endonuclease VapC